MTWNSGPCLTEESIRRDFTLPPAGESMFDLEAPLGCPDGCGCGPCQHGDCGGCLLQEEDQDWEEQTEQAWAQEQEEGPRP